MAFRRIRRSRVGFDLLPLDLRALPGDDDRAREAEQPGDGGDPEAMVAAAGGHKTSGSLNE